MTTYSTKIDKVKVQKSKDGLSNVVTDVWYIVTGTSDDGYIKSLTKLIHFEDTDPASFIDISEVTESMIISWVESEPEYLNDNDKQNFEHRFQLERNNPFYDDYKFNWMPDNNLRYNIGA